MEVLTTIISPSMLIYDVLLGTLLLYWLIVAIGMVDIDAFDFGGGAVDGAIDGALDGGLDGAADGAAHAGVDAAAHSTGVFSHLVGVLNIGHVPIAIVGSTIIVSLWFSALIYNVFLKSMLLGLVSGIALAIIAVAVQIVVCVYLTGFMTRPLRPLFQTHTQHGEQHLVGQLCQICSQRVTEKFGQAEIATAGAPITLLVYCTEENQLTKGAEAVVVHYDADRSMYEVKPM